MNMKNILKLIDITNKLKKLVNSTLSVNKVLLNGINTFLIIETPVHWEKTLSKTNKPGNVKYFINMLFTNLENNSS